MADLFVVDLSPPIKQAIAMVEKGQYEDAFRIFSEMRAREPGNAIVMSYLGLLKAIREGRAYDAIETCQEALKKDPHEALAYLNLARSYMAANDRYQAVRAIHKGLKIRSPHNTLLYGFYQAMGMRRKPVIAFLHRDNVLNRVLGKLTWKMGTHGGFPRPPRSR